MTLSMYQASVPVFIRSLENLSAILRKASDWAAERKIDPAVLIAARLAPDMFALARQVQIASDTVKGAAARLGGIEVPSFPDNEVTFDDLQARIKKTIDFLKTVKAAQIDGSEGKAISFKAGPRELHFTGQGYLTSFVLPNLYFHVTTAYAILRHNGLLIGKMDYLGAVGV
jgi:uncharacterized protein